MINESKSCHTIRNILIALAVGLLIGAGVFLLATRGQGESGRIVEDLQAENRELTERLAGIQAAVDSVGAGIASAASEAGDVADGIGGVIAGLDNSLRLLGELSDGFEEIVRILAGGESPGAP